MSQLKQTSELLSEAEQLNLTIKQGLKSDIAVSFPSKIPSKADYLRNLLLHRISDLSEDSLNLYKSQRSLAGLIVTRALFECVITMYYLQMKIEEALEKSDPIIADSFLVKLILGSKKNIMNNPEFEETLNFLTILGHVEKVVNDISKYYDILCGYAHINFHSLTGLYSEFKGEIIPTIGIKSDNDLLNRAIDALIFCQKTAFDTYNTIADLLIKFIELCNEKCNANN